MSTTIADRLFNTPVSRRQLLRLVGLGAAAATAGVVMGGLPAHAAESTDPAEFERLNKLIIAVSEVARNNPDLAGVRAIRAWAETAPWDKLSADDQVAVTGALALAALDRLATSPLDPQDVRARLERPIDLNGVTAEYLAGVAEQTRAAMKADPGYARRINEATEQLAFPVWCGPFGPMDLWECVRIVLVLITLGM